jgi:ribonuclease BN (tRNA processing enzyme)
MFLGTRGEIDARTRRHRMHTSLLVSYRGADVMIDAGLDWLGKLKRVAPHAIVLTHAHSDHAYPRNGRSIHAGNTRLRRGSSANNSLPSLAVVR